MRAAVTGELSERVPSRPEDPGASRGRLLLAPVFTVAGNRIAEYDVIADPERLRRLDLAILDNQAR